jgi:Domain of unknown function DUF11
VAAVAIAALALPASASADLAVTQVASPKPVKKGELVTITVSVTNPGPATAGSEESQVEVFPLRGSSERAAANPYQSVTPSQGTCTITPTGAYQVADCSFGELPPGASAQIVAVLQVNESMTHVAAPKVGTWSELQVAASVPPTITGAPQIRLAGVPNGCVPGDFALTVTVRAARVRKVSATLNLGFDDSGEGVTWRRSANGRRLTATVPASRIFSPRLDKGYKLTIQATRKGGHALKRTVTFALCG